MVLTRFKLIGPFREADRLKMNFIVCHFLDEHFLSCLQSQYNSHRDTVSTFLQDEAPSHSSRFTNA